MIITLIGSGKFTIFTDALLINSLQSQKHSICDFKVVKSVRKIETFKHHWFNSASALINICLQSKSDDNGDFVEFLNISRSIIWGTDVQIPGLTVQPSSVSFEFRMIPSWLTVSLLRGGPTFDPVLNVKEVSHVKHMHADSLLINTYFSSKLMIRWLNLFENPLLIRFQTDRKLTFDLVRTNEGGSKVKYRTTHDHVIDKLIVNLSTFRFDEQLWKIRIDSFSLFSIKPKNSQ